MEPRYLNANRTYPTFSGECSTDLAVWGLAAALWEIAKNAVAKEMSTGQTACQNGACGERIRQPVDTPAERERLLLKPAEVVGMLGVSRGKVYEMVHTGEIPSIRMGRRIGIPRKAVEKWIAEHCNAISLSNPVWFLPKGLP